MVGIYIKNPHSNRKVETRVEKNVTKLKQIDKDEIRNM